MMVGAPGLVIAALAPVAGVVTDKFGRRMPLLIATFFYGLFGVAPLLLESLPAIFASRFGVGLCEAVILTVSNTLITDYFPLDRRRRWLTVQAVLGPILATGTIILSGILTGIRWNGGFWIYSVAFVVFAALVIFIFEPAVLAPSTTRNVPVRTAQFPWTIVAQYFAVTLFSSILYYVFIVNGGMALNALGVDSPERQSVFISVASVGVPIGALLFGWLARRWPADWLITLYLACLGVGMLGIGLSQNSQMLVAVAIAQQIGAGMAVPVLIFWVSQLLAPEYRGRGMGLWACAFFLGQFLSPAIVGGIRSAADGRILPAFAAMGITALIGAAVSLLLSRRPRIAV